MEAISLLAAHCHMSTSLLLQQTLPHLAPELVSPKTFMECLRVTQNMASVLASREEDSILRLEMALGKLEGVEQAVLQLEGELVCLRPQHKAAEGKVKEMMGQITASKDRLAIISSTSLPPFPSLPSLPPSLPSLYSPKIQSC